MFRSSSQRWLGLAAMLHVGCGDDLANVSAFVAEAGSRAGAAGEAGTGTATVARTNAGVRAPEAGASASRPASGTASGSAGRPAAATAPASAGRSAGSGNSSVAGAGAIMTAGRSGAAAEADSGGVGGRAAAGSGGQPAGAEPTYEPCPMAEVCKILPLGDSITYGIGYDGSYRVELFKSATSDGKKITFTGSLSNGPSMVDGQAFPRNNEGHSGWKIDQLLPLIPMPALQTPPHIVLLMIGTNDIAQNDDLANAPKRLGALLDKLAQNAPDALIIVASIIPLRSSSAVQTYNAAIPELVKDRAATGMHIQFIDQFTGFPTSELGDGVHPNQQGYKRLAGVWYTAISKLLH